LARPSSALRPRSGVQNDRTKKFQNVKNKIHDRRRAIYGCCTYRFHWSSDTLYYNIRVGLNSDGLAMLVNLCEIKIISYYLLSTAVYTFTVGRSTSTTRRQLAMTTDRAAGSMIYRCGGPPGVALVRVVFTRRPYYIPRLLLLRLLLLLAWSSVSPTLLSLTLRLRHSHTAPLTLLLLPDSHRGKRLITCVWYYNIIIKACTYLWMSRPALDEFAIFPRSVESDRSTTTTIRLISVIRSSGFLWVGTTHAPYERGSKFFVCECRCRSIASYYIRCRFNDFNDSLL